MRQTNRETKRNQRNKKDKSLILFNKISTGHVLDKTRKAVIKVVKNSYKGSFITKRYFIFFDNRRAFHEIFSVKCILSVTLFQSLTDLI